MKLVHWHTDRYPTAPGIYLGCFPSRGHQVTWVAEGLGEANAVIERVEGGVRHLEVRRRRDSPLPRPLGTIVNRWNKLQVFFLKLALMRRLARERPDILQVRDLITEGLLAARCARQYGIAFVFQLDHPHPEGRLLEIEREGRGRPLERLVQRYWMWLRGWILRRADLVLPISDAMASRLVTREGLDRRRLVPIPVGVSRDTFERGARTEVSPRAARVSGFPTVCYLGNLHARRDPGLLFRIFEEIAKRSSECRFLVIGALTPAAEKWAREFFAADRLVITGFVPHEEVPSVLVGSSRVDLQACKLEYSIVSPK